MLQVKLKGEVQGALCLTVNKLIEMRNEEVNLLGFTFVLRIR